MRRLRTSDPKWGGGGGGAELKNTIFPVTLYNFQKMGGGGGGDGGGRGEGAEAPLPSPSPSAGLA